MSKRRRLTVPRRPIDKQLIVVSQTVTNTQQSTALFTTTFPCTVTGIRLSFGAVSTLTTGSQTLRAAIVILKDGTTLDTIDLSDGADFYQPETNVLWYVVGAMADADSGQGNIVFNYEGSTKSMRKLMTGDQVFFVARATGTGVAVNGVVQLFLKA